MQPLGSDWLLHQPRTAWSTTDDVVRITNAQGALSRQVHSHQQDVRVVAPWKDLVIAVVRLSDAFRIVVLDRELNEIQSATVRRATDPDGQDDVQVIADESKSYAFVKLNDAVYAFKPAETSMQLTLVEERVRGMGRAADPTQQVALVHDVGGVAFVAVIDTALKRQVSPSVPLAPWSTVVPVGEQIVVLSPIERSRETQVTMVDPVSSSTRTAYLQTSMDLVHPVYHNESYQIARVELVEGRFLVARQRCGRRGVVRMRGQCCRASMEHRSS